MKNLVNEITFKGKDIEKLYQIFASHQSLCGNFSSNEECIKEDKWCDKYMKLLEENYQNNKY